MRLMLTALMVSAAAPAAAQDPAARGKIVFLQCRACHSLKAGEPHKIGPNLHGTIGAPAASRPGYAYSPALKASGIKWTDDRLDAFLAKPAAVVKGTKMAYAGLAKPADRAAVIAYLKKEAR
jgi:cytochrome c